MQVTYSSPRCTVPEAVLRLAEEQFRKLQKYDQRLQSADLRFDIDHGLHRVEARLQVRGAALIVAHGTGESFRTAVDRIIDRLSRQLRRRRERHQGFRLAGGSKDLSAMGVGR
jgi:ribosomal subunit interface protein